MPAGFITTAPSLAADRPGHAARHSCFLFGSGFRACQLGAPGALCKGACWGRRPGPGPPAVVFPRWEVELAPCGLNRFKWPLDTAAGPLSSSAPWRLPLSLPLLSIASTVLTLGASLLAFGAAVGLHGRGNQTSTPVDSRNGPRNGHSCRASMGTFSIGAFLPGSSLMTVLLFEAFEVRFSCTLICSSLMVVAAVLEWPYLLRQAEAEVGPVFDYAARHCLTPRRPHWDQLPRRRCGARLGGRC